MSNDTSETLQAGPGPAAGFTPQQIGAAASKMLSAAIGDICVVLSKSPGHKRDALADIEWRVLPPVLAGQFHVAEAQHQEHGVRAPIAVVTWARVSPEVDRRLTETIASGQRLKPAEWTGGDIWWVIDAVGDPRGLSVAMKALLAGPFKDREVRIAMRDGSGAVRVEALRELAGEATGSRREAR